MMYPLTRVRQWAALLPNAKKDNAPAISVSGLGKIFCQDLLISSGYAVRDMFRLPERVGHGRRLRAGEFWALKDISFDVRHGDVFGVLGGTQSGKSTLAGLLRGLYRADAGTIRASSQPVLINSLGSGYRPMLSVRENAVFRAALLGTGRGELEAFVDQVLGFAELSHLATRPLFNLSRDELRRLGSALAFLNTSSILVIDNILPSGSPEFRDKCLALLQANKGSRTIIYVTSKPAILEAVADRVMVLEQGRSTGIFSPSQGVLEYQARSRMEDGEESVEGAHDVDDAEGERVEAVDELPSLLEANQKKRPRRITVDWVEVEGTPYVMSEKWLWLRAGESVTIRLGLHCLAEMESREIRVSLHVPFDPIPIAERFFCVAELLPNIGGTLRLANGDHLDVSFAFRVPELPKGNFGICLTCMPLNRQDVCKADICKILTFAVRETSHKGLRTVLSVATMTAERSAAAS